MLIAAIPGKTADMIPKTVMPWLAELWKNPSRWNPIQQGTDSIQPRPRFPPCHY